MNLNNQQSFARTFLKQIMLTGLTALTASMAFAVPSDRNEPVSLVADRATFNEKTGITTYTGNVIN